MRKEDAIKKFIDFSKKHPHEATAVHEAGHMCIAKGLFPEKGWHYSMTEYGEPMVKGNGPFEFSTAKEITDIIRYCIAGIVSEAHWLGIGDYIMDILKWELDDEKKFAESNEGSTGDCTDVEKLMATYNEWFGRDFDLAIEVKNILGTFRHKGNKQAYMAEVHAAKRYFKDKQLKFVA